jgi:hypothetical protein
MSIPPARRKVRLRLAIQIAVERENRLRPANIDKTNLDLNSAKFSAIEAVPTIRG